ncbi:MAG: hypothetical protein RL748_271 [Pseudomonadota bacterium]|jgi:hypothetical protein
METIYNVDWNGPFTVEDVRSVEHLANDRDENDAPYYVLYMVCGTHGLYGRNVPLYIGKTERGIKVRMDEHEKSWFCHQPDPVSIYVACIAHFEDWKGLEQASYSASDLGDGVISGIEKLLIHAHQPVYNTSSKNSVSADVEALRIFNTGKRSCLLPEISTLYMLAR